MLSMNEQRDRMMDQVFAQDIRNKDPHASKWTCVQAERERLREGAVTVASRYVDTKPL